MKRALEAAAAALQLAIDSREMTMYEFQREYGKLMSVKGGITRELIRALRRVRRAIK